MESQTTNRFWKAYDKLPSSVQKTVKKIYRRWQENPYDPNLKFKQIHPVKPIYSVRIGLDWRVVGIKEENTVIWFWIGSHAEYDKLISQL